MSKDSVVLLLNKFGKTQKSFYSLHYRPKLTRDIGTLSPRLSKSYDPVCAIVLQGPIVREENFTLETIRLYKKHYPQAKIIISTWSSEKDHYTESFVGEGIELVFSELPTISGYWNINYQAVSSLAGILKARELGATYVMKTRSDQRFYETNLLNYLVSLSNQFPLARDVLINQKMRLILLSMGTCKYRAYAFSDMLVFGHIDDVESYWDVPLDTRIHKKRNFANMLEEIQFRAPEIYFLENYMKKHNRELIFTIKDSWNILAKHFCIVDESTLDLYWGKYMPNTEYRYRYYDHSRTSEMVSFKEWFLIYNNQIDESVDEQILLKWFGEKI